jgi:hypothetical protein
MSGDGEVGVESCEREVWSMWQGGGEGECFGGSVRSEELGMEYSAQVRRYQL